MTYLVQMSKTSHNELAAAKTEYERLLEEISELKALIISLIAERDELKFHVCRDLAAEYNSRIGVLEFQAMTARLKVLELKRTIEYPQAQINRQEEKSEEKARKQARQEYKKFEEDLNQKAEEAKRTDRYQEDTAKKEEEWQREQERKEQEARERGEEPDENRVKYKSRSDEMKALYRKIVKALHPDMNPDQTEEEKDLFREAVEAYNNGDLDKLREIAAMIDEGDIDSGVSDPAQDLERLKEIIEVLKKRVETLQKEIENIKTTFPYTMKDFLADEDAVRARQKELADIISVYNKQAEELEERLAAMRDKE